MKVLRFHRKFRPPCRYFPTPKRPFETGDIWTLHDKELRVYLYLCWKLWGFGKSEDQISYIQMRDGIHDRDGNLIQAGTGLSIPTIRRATRALQQSGWIRIWRKSRTEPLFYEILNPLLAEPASDQSSDTSKALHE